MRLAIILVVALLAAPVVIIGGFIGRAMWAEYAFARDTPLAAGLHGQWDAMRDTFRHRVQKQFPAGTPVTNVIATLIAQGFKPATSRPPSVFTKSDDDTAKFDAMPMRSAMMVNEPNPICNMTWTVAWDLDASQRVTRTYGELGGYCL